MTENMYFDDCGSGTMYLPDGTMEVICSDRNFTDIVLEKMGRNAEQCIINLINGQALEEIIASKKIETDLNSYESSLDSNRVSFNDLLESVNQMMSMIDDGKRFSKDKAYKILIEMEKNINNQI